jgi:hypothetical protein
MHSENRINQLSNNTVLEWWASKPAGQDYVHVVAMARTLGVKTSMAEVRRDIRRRLLWLRLLSIDRAPTNEDCLKAKERWRVQWRNQPLV